MLPFLAAFLSLFGRKSKKEREERKRAKRVKENLREGFYVPSRAHSGRLKHVERIDLRVRNAPDFEKFSGNSYDHVDDFLVRFAQECDASDWDIWSAIKAFPNHLTGDALNWYRRQPWPTPGPNDSVATLKELWVDIVVKLRSFFDNTYEVDQAKRSMAELTQGGTESLRKFIRRFEDLAQIIGNGFDRYSTIRAKLNELVCSKLDALGITEYDQLVKRADEVDEKLTCEYKILRLAIANDLHLEARPLLAGVPVQRNDAFGLYTTRNNVNIIGNPEEWFSSDGIYDRERVPKVFPGAGGLLVEDAFDDFVESQDRMRPYYEKRQKQTNHVIRANDPPNRSGSAPNRPNQNASFNNNRNNSYYNNNRNNNYFNNNRNNNNYNNNCNNYPYGRQNRYNNNGFSQNGQGHFARNGTVRPPNNTFSRPYPKTVNLPPPNQPTPGTSNSPNPNPPNDPNAKNRFNIYGQGGRKATVNVVRCVDLPQFRLNIDKTWYQGTNLMSEFCMRGDYSQAMIDTGGETHVIDSKFVEGYESLMRPLSRMVEGVHLNPIGEISMNVHIKGQAIVFTFVVAKNYVFPALIGTDVLRCFNLITDHGLGRITQRRPMRGYMHAAEDVVVRGRRVMFIKATVSKDLAVPGMELVTGFDNMKYSDKNKLICQNSVIDVKDDKQIQIGVLNGALRDRHVKKGEVIGRVETVLPHQIVSLTEDQVDEPEYEPPTIDEFKNGTVSYLTEAKEDGELVRKVTYKGKVIAIGKDLDTKEEEELLVILDKREKVISVNGFIGSARGVEYHIPLKPGAKPVRHGPPRASPEKMKIIDAEVDKMLAQGIIQESFSEWASRVVLVYRKSLNGEPPKARICVDFRDLNSELLFDSYPTPDTQMCIDALQGSTYFSQIDLNSAFHQIRLDAESRQLTAFVTPSGRVMEFLVTPYGLSIAMQAFMRILDIVLSGLRYEICCTFVDDCVIYARSFAEHSERLDRVLGVLEKNGLTINLAKCQFAVKAVHFLGFRVDGTTVGPAPSIISKVNSLSPPRNVTDVKSILGTLNYVRRLVPKFSFKLRELTLLTRKNAVFKWTEEHQKILDELKHIISSKPVIFHYNSKFPIKLYTDGSNIGIGAVLMQDTGSGDHPIGYFSRCLTDTEKRYPVYFIELLAFTEALEFFDDLLMFRSFQVYVDNCAVSYIMKRQNIKDMRVVRAVFLLHSYQFKINLIKGSDNFLADFLSRHPADKPLVPAHMYGPENDPILINIITVINSLKQCIKNEQANDFETQEIVKEIESDKYKNRYVLDDGMLYDVTKGFRRTFIPKDMRMELISNLHDPFYIAHQGAEKTMGHFYRKFFWPEMHKDVKDYVTTCHRCQVRKALNQKRYGSLNLNNASWPFHTLVIDHIGPLRSSNGNKYIIVAICAYTRFVFCKGVPSPDAVSTARFIINEIVYPYCAVPMIIQTDRHANFCSKLVKSLMNQLGTKHAQSSGYHPQTQGVVERFNRTIIDMITMYINKTHSNWSKLLRAISYAHNTTVQSTTGVTPCELFFGRKPVLPTDINLISDDTQIKFTNKELRMIDQIARDNIDKNHAYTKKNYDAKHRKPDFAVGDDVVFQDDSVATGPFNKMTYRWLGPYTVLEVNNNNTVKIDINRPNQIVNVSKLCHYRRRFGSTEQHTTPRRMINKVFYATLLFAVFFAVVTPVSGMEPVNSVVFKVTPIKVIGNQTRVLFVMHLRSICEDLTSMTLENNFTLTSHLARHCMRSYSNTVTREMYAGCTNRVKMPNLVKDIAKELKAHNDKYTESTNDTIFPTTNRLLVSLLYSHVSMGIYSYSAIEYTKLDENDLLGDYGNDKNWTNADNIATDRSLLEMHTDKINDIVIDTIRELRQMNQTQPMTKIDEGELLSDLNEEFTNTGEKIKSFFSKFRRGLMDSDFDDLFPQTSKQICANCDLIAYTPIRCSRATKDIFVLEYLVAQVQKQKKVLEADAFVQVRRVNNRDCLFHYNGPEYVIDDTDENCTMPVLTTTIDKSKETVPEPDEPTTCKPIDVTYAKTKCLRKGEEIPQNVAIQTRSDKDNHLFYCHKEKVAINGFEFQCEDGTYMIPKNKRVIVGTKVLSSRPDPPSYIYVTSRDLIYPHQGRRNLYVDCANEVANDIGSWLDDAHDWVRNFDYGGRINKKYAPAFTYSSGSAIFIGFWLAFTKLACEKCCKRRRNRRMRPRICHEEFMLAQLNPVCNRQQRLEVGWLLDETYKKH